MSTMSVNLDDLRRLREEAMADGAGSGRWIKCAQALMDQFPAYYETAKAINERHAEARGDLQRAQHELKIARDQKAEMEAHWRQLARWIEEKQDLGDCIADLQAGVAQ